MFTYYDKNISTDGRLFGQRVRGLNGYFSKHSVFTTNIETCNWVMSNYKTIVANKLDIITC